MSAKIIAIEGLDGAGKSTCVRELSRKIKMEHGYTVKAIKFALFTKEHKRYNNIIKCYVPDDSSIYAFLTSGIAFVEGLCQFEEHLLPNLRRYDIILVERYKVGLICLLKYYKAPQIKDMIKILDSFPEPDVTLLFDLPIQVAVNRLIKKGEKLPPWYGNYLKQISYFLHETLQEQNHAIIDAATSYENIVESCLENILLEVQR